MASTDSAIAAVRRFNRFYTRRIGVLGDHMYQTPFSLTEGRVLYEIAHHEPAGPGRIGRALGLDAGYLSRILRGLERRGVVSRKRAAADGRQVQLTLTARGRKVFAELDAGSDREVAGLLAGLDEPGKRRLLGALHAIEELLGEETAEPDGRRGPLIIRQQHPGDLGWIVLAHGVLYDQEYGWDETMEGLIAEIVGKFARQHDPARERCWIAELDGENVGCIMCCRESDDVARLRLLLVHPRARGRSLGTRLVDECMKFARRAGYQRMVLWTNDVLIAARRIYEKAGWVLTREEKHHSFGKDLVGQTWEVELVSRPTG